MITRKTLYWASYRVAYSRRSEPFPRSEDNIERLFLCKLDNIIYIQLYHDSYRIRLGRRAACGYKRCRTILYLVNEKKNLRNWEEKKTIAARRQRRTSSSLGAPIRVSTARRRPTPTRRARCDALRYSTSVYSPAAARQKQPMVQARRRVVAFAVRVSQWAWPVPYCSFASAAGGGPARARACTHTHTHARAQRHARTRNVPHQRRHRPATHATPQSFYYSIYRRAGHGPVNAFKNKSRRLRRRLVDRGDACQQAF